MFEHLKQYVVDWRMGPWPVGGRDDARDGIPRPNMDVQDYPQDNLTAFIDELRRHSRSQKAMWAQIHTFNACIYPMMAGTNTPYWSRFPNAFKVSYRYFTVFREEFCIILNQTRRMKDELESLHQEFSDTCQHGILSPLPVRGDGHTHGYILEHLLKRALEGELRKIDGEADKLRAGLQNCQLLLSAIWRIVSKCEGSKRRLPSDDLARSGWRYWILEAEDPENPSRRCRDSSEETLWYYDMSVLPQSLLKSIAKNRGGGWWMQDPDLKEDLVRQSEVSWDRESVYGNGTGSDSGDGVNGEAALENARRADHTYRSWGSRRFRRAVLEHDRIFKTTGRGQIKDPMDLNRRRYEVLCAGPGANLDVKDAIISNNVHEQDNHHERPAGYHPASATESESGTPPETTVPGRGTCAQDATRHLGQEQLEDPTNGARHSEQPVSGNYGDFFGSLERLERLLRITGRAEIE